VTPERKRWMSEVDGRGKSINSAEHRVGAIGEPKDKAMFGNYNRLRHTFATEICQELDNKIAAIREKYNQYSRNELAKSRHLMAREPDQRAYYNNENDLGMGISMELRKKLPDDEGGRGTKFMTGEFAAAKSTVERPATRLGLRRLNLLMEGY
jgi:hypothetical protein